MAQPVQQATIRAPGFQGLNTELSPLNGDPEFALVADNVVVDQIGRLVSRKAFADHIKMGDAEDVYVSDFLKGPSGYYATDYIEIGRNGFFANTSNEYDPTLSEEGKNYIRENVSVFTVRISECEQIAPYIDASGSVEYKINFRNQIGSLIVSYASTIPGDPSVTIPDEAELPDVLGTVKIYQGANLLVDQEYRVREWNKVGHGATGPAGQAERWEASMDQFIWSDTITTTDPLTPIRIEYTPDPRTYLPDQDSDLKHLRLGLLLKCWPTVYWVDGVVGGGIGYSEIIKLGSTFEDPASSMSIHSQMDQNVAMVFRYGDGYDFSANNSQPRALPTGMGMRVPHQRNIPEITGDIAYGVGLAGTDEIIQLALPAGWGGTNREALITGQFVNFKDELFLFAKGQPFLKLAGGAFNEQATGTNTIDGDIAISAYGRLWVAGVGGDYHTIWYSTLLDETSWYDPATTSFNDGGVIDVREYWPVDGDSIVNIHAHNGFLLVFGRNSILVYANADSGSPAGILNQQDSGIFLQDTISNVGLVRRDAICNIGTDVLFVDDSGVRSIGRVIQEKSNPLQEPSLNIRRELQQVIQESNAVELAGYADLDGNVTTKNQHQSSIKLNYLPSESIAVLSFSNLMISYVFHLNMPSKTGGMKVTRWTNCFWNDCIELKQNMQDVVYMAGRPSKGLLKYDGYLEGATLPTGGEPYVMRYESMAVAMGQNAMQTIIPKSIHYVCMGEFIPGQANALWGFSDTFIGNKEFRVRVDGGTEFNVNEFTDDGDTALAGKYVAGGPYYSGYKINTSGSGELFRVGFEVKVQGGRYGLQEININSAIGRLTA